MNDLHPPPRAPVSQKPLTKSDAQLVAEACGRGAQILGLSREKFSAVVACGSNCGWRR